MARQAGIRFSVARTLVLPLVLLAAAAPPARCQIAVPPEAARLYALRGDSLLWHDGLELSRSGNAAVRLLSSAADHGLDPGDYDAALLDSLSRTPARTPDDRKRLDLLLTVDVVRFLEHLQGGRAPHRPRRAIAAALRDAIAGDTLPALAAALEPRLVHYRYLRRALAEYRLLAEDTTFGPLPSGGTIRPGEPYGAAQDLARLLAALGDLPADAALTVAGAMYGGPLPEGVTRFQERHGLEPDGVIGPTTFRSLNTPLRWRVRQLELAMERLRRIPLVRGERLVVVNVPAFRLFAFDSAGAGGAPALGSRVVVGRAVDTRTPTLFEEMRYVDFWPYWNVPRSILINEILPILRRRPDYLRRNDMEVVDLRGRVLGGGVSAAILDGLRSGTLRVRQRPGPGNALGAVKFVFPNAASVYIHGTPHTEVFQRPRRDLSHGCIRVEDFAGLATWLLRGQSGWTADSTAAVLAARRSRRVTLERPLRVAVFYTTAAATSEGRVYFHEDLYGLDRRLDAEIRAPAYLP
jgi:murein L,D-transpeptidase YcbB/YkuD